MECLDFKKLMSKMSGKKMEEEFCFEETIFFLSRFEVLNDAKKKTSSI